MGDKEGVPTLNMALHDGSAVPTPLVARCEELRTEWGGLRRQRGRLRSQLQAIKEDIQVILVVPDNAEDPTVLELERREKVHEEELLVIEGELAKVEADLAECLSVRSREGSIRDFGTDVPGGAAVPTLTAVALAGLPSGVENPRDGRVKILPPVVASGGSPSSPSSSSSSPSALSSYGPVPDHRRYSYAPDPPLAYYAGRRVRKGRILTADAVGKICFPKLTDRFKLKAYLGAFGRLLVEAGGGIHMSSRGEERFVPVKTLECTITIAFLATLEEKEVKEAARTDPQHINSSLEHSSIYNRFVPSIVRNKVGNVFRHPREENYSCLLDSSHFGTREITNPVLRSKF